MIRKNFRKTSSRVEFLLGLLVLAFLVVPVSSAKAVATTDEYIKVSDNALRLTIPLPDLSPYLSKLNDIKNEMVASVALAANLLSSFTDNLRNAWKAYVNPLPIPSETESRILDQKIGTPVITVASPPPLITDEALLRALRILFAQKDYLGDLEEFRGAQGPQGKEGIPGTPGLQGIPGPSGSSSVTYIPSNPSTNFGGASIFSVTDLSSNKLITET